MRETKYATELRTPGRIQWGNDEGRIERLFIKATKQEEIRFSWWTNGKMATRPLDLSEDELILLFRDAVTNDVFTPTFRAQLRELL